MHDDVSDQAVRDTEGSLASVLLRVREEGKPNAYWGTAFAVGSRNDRIILATCRHCVTRSTRPEPGENLTVKWDFDVPAEIHKVTCDRGVDLALIEVAAPPRRVEVLPMVTKLPDAQWDRVRRGEARLLLVGLPREIETASVYELGPLVGREVNREIQFLGGAPNGFSGSPALIAGASPPAVVGLAALGGRGMPTSVLVVAQNIERLLKTITGATWPAPVAPDVPAFRMPHAQRMVLAKLFEALRDHTNAIAVLKDTFNVSDAIVSRHAPPRDQFDTIIGDIDRKLWPMVESCLRDLPARE